MLWNRKGLQKQIRLSSAAGLQRSQKWRVSKSKTQDLHMSEKDKQIQKMLEDIWNGQPPYDDSPETFIDSVLNAIDYKDFPALHSMLGALNLYLDLELSYGWCEVSFVALKSLGLEINHAHNIWTWIHHFLHDEKFPLHQYGQYHSSILEDEDFAQDIQLHLSEVQQQEGCIQAQDIVDYVAIPKVQERLGAKVKVVSKQTAQWWLCKLDWHYGQKQNYTPKGFPIAQAGQFRLILITHNESTFYANNHHKMGWSHLNMLTSEWGRLQHGDELIYVQQCTKSPKTSTRCFVSSENVKKTLPELDTRDSINPDTSVLFSPTLSSSILEQEDANIPTSQWLMPFFEGEKENVQVGSGSCKQKSNNAGLANDKKARKST
ncbi:uncharacterized protein EDB93DRAFT_1104728 [Suillus bovinus]|uniref:uncharacterized protein n=1 Tax=Suillus bovinus TaxID=48563 RepID=UPI001B85DE30|nr:uncharacterized protein EDB93DRAFT_1104728 [Suillus bovinus]KAG2145489.1 hypothetical protein EDB93DRAFT_1104728 [Suillus bovinus]